MFIKGKLLDYVSNFARKCPLVLISAVYTIRGYYVISAFDYFVRVCVLFIIMSYQQLRSYRDGTTA